MNKRFKIKIDYGETIEIVYLWFEDEIDALEFCKRKSGIDVRYTLL